MSENIENEKTITIDGEEKKVSDLSPQARGLLAFVTRIDEDLRDARYKLERAQMARQQALQQLTRVLNAKDEKEATGLEKKEKKKNN